MDVEETFVIPKVMTGDVKEFILPKPFRHPVSMFISGTTGSGKTTWVYNFIKNLNLMFQNEYPKNVLYCYGIYQDMYSKMENEFDFISFHEGIPSRDTILSLSYPSMIILDDLAHKVYENTDMELLFSQFSHHKKILVCLLKNNLFYQGKNSRTISLNTNIFVLMRNPADVSQIHTLARQIFPKSGHYLIDSYDFASKLNNGKGYLIVDLSAIPTTDVILKTGIFPDEDLIFFLH